MLIRFKGIEIRLTENSLFKNIGINNIQLFFSHSFCVLLLINKKKAYTIHHIHKSDLFGHCVLARDLPMNKISWCVVFAFLIFGLLRRLLKQRGLADE